MVAQCGGKDFGPSGRCIFELHPWPPSCIGSPVGDRGSQGKSKGFVNNGVEGPLLAFIVRIIMNL